MSIRDKIIAGAAVIALGLIGAVAYSAVSSVGATSDDVQNETTHVVDTPHASLFRSTAALADVITAMDNTIGGAEEKARTRIRKVDELVRQNRAIRIERGQEVRVLKETGDGPSAATILDLRFNGRHYISLETYFRPLY